MHTQSLEPWRHDHSFGQETRKAAERRTLIVIVITAITMGVEIGAGLVFGSMALLADGLHMGSHAAALAISAFAYFYTRRHARDPRFNFGTGKVNSLAGFASAVILVLFALAMAWESVARLLAPVAIEFNQAVFVAVLGLIVNGVCLAILGGAEHAHDSPQHHHGDGHEHHHEDEHHHHGGAAHDAHEHEHEHAHAHARPGARHVDHNLLSAYLHVLADALTSVLAIVALLAAKHYGQTWLDPFMGIVGAVLVVRWSWGLLRATARVLLDMQAPEPVREAIRQAIEAEGDNRISDLHVWEVGAGIYAAEIAVVSSLPLAAERYLALLPHEPPLAHVTVEVRACNAQPPSEKTIGPQPSGV